VSDELRYSSGLGDPRKEMKISGATPDELKHALETKETCGECRYFELAEGRRLMEAQRFVERLVQEEGWQVKHLCSPLNDLGICGAHSSGAAGGVESITGRMHKSCDQFRRGDFVSLRRKTTDAK
jgi:hypothetical protein